MASQNIALSIAIALVGLCVLATIGQSASETVSGLAHTRPVNPGRASDVAVAQRSMAAGTSCVRGAWRAVRALAEGVDDIAATPAARATAAAPTQSVGSKAWQPVGLQWLRDSGVYTRANKERSATFRIADSAGNLAVDASGARTQNLTRLFAVSDAFRLADDGSVVVRGHWTSRPDKLLSKDLTPRRVRYEAKIARDGDVELTTIAAEGSSQPYLHDARGNSIQAANGRIVANIDGQLYIFRGHPWAWNLFESISEPRRINLPRRVGGLLEIKDSALRTEHPLGNPYRALERVEYRLLPDGTLQQTKVDGPLDLISTTTVAGDGSTSHAVRKPGDRSSEANHTARAVSQTPREELQQLRWQIEDHIGLIRELRGRQPLAKRQP